MTNPALEYEEPIHSYGDKDAIEDGVIHALDPENRVTNNLLEYAGHMIWKLKSRQDHEFKEGDGEAEAATKFFMMANNDEFAHQARKLWDSGSILKLALDFAVSEKGNIWVIPNEVGGLTFMLPEDY